MAIFNALYPVSGGSVTAAAATASADVALPTLSGGEVPLWVLLTVVTTVGSASGGYAAYQDAVSVNFGTAGVTGADGLTLTATDPATVIAVPAGATHIGVMRHALATQDTHLAISALCQPGSP